MVDAISIALSGLVAQGQSLAVAASNIANASTTGALPTPEAPASTVYKPLSVSYSALTVGNSPGGVTATVLQDAHGYSPVFDPTNIYANNQGLVAAPNIDLIQQSVKIMESKLLFKANLSIIKAEKEMMGEFINAVT